MIQEYCEMNILFYYLFILKGLHLKLTLAKSIYFKSQQIIIINSHIFLTTLVIVVLFM